MVSMTPCGPTGAWCSRRQTRPPRRGASGTGRLVRCTGGRVGAVESWVELIDVAAAGQLPRDVRVPRRRSADVRVDTALPRARGGFAPRWLGRGTSWTRYAARPTDPADYVFFRTAAGVTRVVRLVVNGIEHDRPAGRDLLSVLREQLGLTAAKPGCGEGVCGACTVLVGGAPVRSCCDRGRRRRAAGDDAGGTGTGSAGSIRCSRRSSSSPRSSAATARRG